MPALRDVQAAFAAYLAGEDRPHPATGLAGDAAIAATRLRIHRNHIGQSLAAALASTFPTVQAVVGEDFFRVLARAFIAGDLPRQPVLAEYGAGFPDFVSRYGPCASLPYLADVARLDWALNVAFHSPAGNVLTVDDFSAVPTDRLAGLSLALAPGTAVVRSDYPIDRIWRISRPGAAAETVELDAGAVTLLVLRRPDDAAFVGIDEAEAAFLSAVAGGATLEAAAKAGFEANSAFGLSTAFARLLALQIFAAMQHVRSSDASKRP